MTITTRDRHMLKGASVVVLAMAISADSSY